MLSVPATADKLTVSQRTVYRLLTSGELKSVKVRGRRMVTEKQLDAYVSRLERRR